MHDSDDTTPPPQADEVSEPDLPPVRIRRLSPDDRLLLWAWGISLLLHGMGFVGMKVAGYFDGEFQLEFDESRGIALLSRSGYVARSEDPPGTQLPVIADELVVPPPDADPEATVEEAEAEPEEEEIVEEEGAAEEPAGEASGPPSEPPPPSAEELARQAEEAEAAARAEAARQARLERQRQARLERQARERAEREAAEREAAERARAERAAQGPDMGLPPSERYPEGTLNPIATDIGMWGPEGSRVTLIMRNDRVRRNLHRRNLELILSGLPDWQTLAGGARLNPFDEVDAMLIATSDPRYINRTFLAAVHRIDPREILARLQTGFPGGLTWEVQRGGRLLGSATNPERCPTQRDPDRACDPRVVLLPTADLFVVSRPEYIQDLNRGAPSARGLTDAAAWVQDPTSWTSPLDAPAEDGVGEGSGTEGEGRRRPRFGQAAGAAAASLANRSRRMVLDDEPPSREGGWVAGLRQIADFGGTGAEGPAMVATLAGIAQLDMPGLRGPRPSMVHASAFLETDPRVTGRLTFGSRNDAEAWIHQWPRFIDHNRIPLGVVGLYQALRNVAWELDHNEATFTMVIPRATLDFTANSIAALNQRRHGGAP
jgi:hypothetical protein